MVREELRAVLSPTDQLEPLGDRAVTLRARCARYLSVRDVANEDVRERILGLAGHGAAPLTAHELLALERVQQSLGLAQIDPGGGVQRTRPEELADDGGVLKQRLLRRREPVEAGGDDSL